MPYDYAPRLALLARARKRRHTWFTVCLLALPALSFQAMPRQSSASNGANSPAPLVAQR